jgi:hypothetical protein
MKVASESRLEMENLHNKPFCMQTFKPMSIKANVTLHEVRLALLEHATVEEKRDVKAKKMKNKMTCYISLAYHS